jgi:hypothetical protein
MLLHVQYKNEKFDYVNPTTLDGLIAAGQLKKLYRPIDRNWVVVGVDAVRGSGGSYTGTNRRQDS